MEHPDPFEVPRYAGLATYAKLPRLEDVTGADIAVLGVPFDNGASYRPGARFGPAHVRDASRLLSPYNPAQEVYPFAAKRMVDAGDVIATPFDIGLAIQQIESHAVDLGEKVERIVTIGGDHTIALPLLRAINKKVGPVAVLHFDAHLDTWSSNYGASITHGTPFRRASEEGLIDQTASMHVGIHGPIFEKADLEDDRALGFQLITAEFIEENGVSPAIEKMRSRLGDRPVYLSIDIDVIDPAHAPGTGFPEAGGLTSREVLRMIRALTDLNLVGADVVEVAPAYDHAQITGIAASHIIFEILSAMAAN